MGPTCQLLHTFFSFNDMWTPLLLRHHHPSLSCEPPPPCSLARARAAMLGRSAASSPRAPLLLCHRHPSLGRHGRSTGREHAVGPLSCSATATPPSPASLPRRGRGRPWARPALGAFVFLPLSEQCGGWGPEQHGGWGRGPEFPPQGCRLEALIWRWIGARRGGKGGATGRPHGGGWRRWRPQRLRRGEARWPGRGGGVGCGGRTEETEAAAGGGDAGPRQQKSSAGGNGCSRGVVTQAYGSREPHCQPPLVHALWTCRTRTRLAGTSRPRCCPRSMPASRPPLCGRAA